MTADAQPDPTTKARATPIYQTTAYVFDNADHAAALHQLIVRFRAWSDGLEGLDDDAVDFKDTYDERNKEPVVLAAGFPNLLANGSSGIAVGMATSIPPHNPAECIDAAIYLLDNPKANVDDPGFWGNMQTPATPVAPVE